MPGSVAPVTSIQLPIWWSDIEDPLVRVQHRSIIGNQHRSPWCALHNGSSYDGRAFALLGFPAFIGPCPTCQPPLCSLVPLFLCSNRPAACQKSWSEDAVSLCSVGKPVQALTLVRTSRAWKSWSEDAVCSLCLSYRSLVDQELELEQALKQAQAQLCEGAPHIHMSFYNM